MRIALLFGGVFALGACKGEQATRSPANTVIVEPPPPPPPADAAPTLPSADELGPVTGNLSGAPFTPAKARLWVTARGAVLEMYAKAQGGGCTHQFAPNPDDLYLSVQVPLASVVDGATITSDTRGVNATWKKPTYDPVDEDLVITLDGLDDKVGTMRGRIELRGADGTRVRGAFEGALCKSPNLRQLPAASLHGVTHGDTVKRDQLPRAAVEMMYLGTRSTPAVVEYIDASQSMSTQHELHFFRDKPATPCNAQFLGPGFTVALGESAAAKGTVVDQRVTTAHAPGSPFAVVMWSDPGDILGMEGNGRVLVEIDAVNDTSVQGRIVASFEDPGRSMLAGAFSATRCK